MKKIILTFATVLGMGSGAQAGFMIEPHLGYESGTFEAKSAFTGADSGGKFTGTVLGARVGYKFPMMLWVAGDVDLSTGKFAPNAAGSSSSDTNRTTMFLDVGIDLPILLRGWIGYGFSDEVTIKGSTGDSKFKGGTAMKLGVGFTALPLLSINLELIQRTLKDLESGGLTFPVNTLYSSTKDTSYILSVSIPFNI